MNRYTPFHGIISVHECMSPTQPLKNAHFSDIFSGSSDDLHECINSSLAGKSPFYPVKKDVWISNSLFHDCTCSKSGGAVSSDGTTVERMFIEETTFTTCKTTSDTGGGIYFVNEEKGECVIFRTCSFNCSSLCSSGSAGQYDYILTKNDESSKNEVNESIIAGTKASGNSCDLLHHEKSNIKSSSVNITNNVCHYYPALYCCSTGASACTCCVIYASIVNNSATDSGCICFENIYSTQLTGRIRIR